MGVPYSRIEEFAISRLGGYEMLENHIIAEINKLTDELANEQNQHIEELSKFEWKDIENIMLSNKEDVVHYLFHYHYLSAKDAYEQIFKNITKLVSNPNYFFPSLIDTLRLDFNTELFMSTNSFSGCKGFLFELEGGTSYNSKMGIVLTPLALQSVDAFFGTLFHELAHRLYYVRLNYNSEVKEKTDHEFIAKPEWF